jgi:hypothetical protein
LSIKQAIYEAAKSQEETIREVSSRYASLFPLIKYLDSVTLQVPAQDLAEHPVRYQIAQDIPKINWNRINIKNIEQEFIINIKFGSILSVVSDFGSEITNKL